MPQRTLLSLPAEVLVQILSLLTPDELYAFSLTCRQAHDVVGDNDSWPAWKGSYCTLFDDPADSGWRIDKPSPGKGGLDWRALTQACFAAARALLDKTLGPDTPVVSYLALLHLLHTSPSSGSPSKNLSVLHPRLLPSLLDFPPGHGARPLLAQLILNLDHLASYAWDKPSEELGAARELVYDVSTYADQPNFGPFFVGFGFSADPADDGGVRVRGVDWEKTNALAQLMGDNVRRSAEQGDWEGDPDGLPLRADRARPGSCHARASGLSDAVPGDWAGVDGTWQGGYAFLDYPDWISFNYPRLTRRVTRMSLEGYDEVVGNMMTLALSVPPSPSSAAGERLQPYTFSGSSSNPLVGVSRVDGVVAPLSPSAHPLALASFAGPPQETRVSMQISYGGAPRWALEGTLLEGARGIVGVWTEVDRERRSPCGPFWFYRAAPEGPEAGEADDASAPA